MSGNLSERELASDDVRRTLVVAGGTVLCLAPMRTIFTDWAWLGQTIGAMVCVLGPAVLLRLRRTPRVVHLLPGLVLLVFYVTAVYLHRSAIDGIIPGTRTWHELGVLRAQAADQIRTSSSPLDSTPVLRLGVVPALALVSAIVDAYAVVRRAPALAGIPLLALFTICGATAGRSVGWFDFTVAAAGFLVILSADSRVSLMNWGRVVPRRSGDTVVRPRLGLSGRRVGVAAVVLAVLLPTVLPGLSGNRLADAFHPGTGGGGGGLSPFASLKGQLNRGKAVSLADVTITGAGSVPPFYLRSKVLNEFTTAGWQSDEGPAVLPIGPASFGSPFARQPDTTDFSAHVVITGMTDDAVPLFGRPRDLTGLSSDFKWDGADDTARGATITRGDTYEEQVAQPDPSQAQFQSASAPPVASGQIDPSWLTVPDTLPSVVTSTVATIVAGKSGPYERAKALSDYFTDGLNGFSYDLTTKAGDSGSDLVDFLNNRVGYCQQYAAALGIMLRVAHIPSRVVLGYTHAAENSNGKFTITSHDAHAWVEAYFTDLGWIPFDPTPLDSSRATSLPYDPRPSVSAAGSSNNDVPTRSASVARRSETSSASAAGAAGTNHGSGGLDLPSWVGPVFGGLAGFIVLLSIVPFWRSTRRRARVRDALRTRTLDPLWRELRDSTVDTGTAWGTATTPRQVPAWLAGLGITGAQGLTPMARRVERERYARQDADTQASTVEVQDAIEHLDTVRRALRSRLRGRQRLRATLWPRSVTTGRRSR